MIKYMQMEFMIPVSRALQLIVEESCQQSSLSKARTVLLTEALGLVLAENIFSPIAVPSFAQSNMDGYAFSFMEGNAFYRLCGEMAAGTSQPVVLPKGKAVRIFTGAPLPEGADTVLMIEKSSLQEDMLQILDEQLKKGDHVRLPGTEIKKDELALSSGTLLGPAAIGFLASLGITEVKAYPRPVISLLVTGNELQTPGVSLEYGQVYDSNSFTLLAALEQLQIGASCVLKSKDDPEELSSLLDQLLQTSDLILMTGGVSMGDYDFTLKAFESCGVEAVFHKVRQKPGKPLLFGRKNNKMVFGLPGNPASVLTCFYEYVLPAIGHFMQQDFSLKKLQVPLAHNYKKPAGLSHFLKANYDGSKVTLQSGQESFKLSSYATANCLAVIPEEISDLQNGTLISIHLLP